MKLNFVVTFVLISCIFFITPSQAQLASNASVKGQLKQYKRVSFQSNSFLKQVKTIRQGAIRLDLGDNLKWDLELERFSVRGPNYAVRLVTANGITTLPPSEENSFRGKIRGIPNSHVRISVSDGHLMGMIDAGDKNPTYIEKLNRIDVSASATEYAVYTEQDVIDDGDATCGVVSPSGTVIETIKIPAISTQSDAQACTQIDLAIAAENSMLVGYSSVAGVEKRINDVYLLVDGLYMDSRVAVKVRISEIFIEMTKLNTFGTSKDMQAYLKAFIPWAKGTSGFKNPWDVAAMWWYERQGGVVGLAYIGVICNKSGMVIKDFSSNIRTQKIDAAHELGHNFSSPHYDGNTLLMNPSINGTNDQWNDASIDKVVTHKNSRTCMAACDLTPIFPQITDSHSNGFNLFATTQNGKLRIEGISPGGNVEFSIKRVNGTQVQKVVSRQEQGRFTQEFDIKGLSGGQYLVEVHGGGVQLLRQWFGI